MASFFFAGVMMDDQVNSDTVDMDSCDTFSRQTNIVRSNSYRMLSDINSLAWGICEESNNEYEGALFRELLFVVGDHGLIVHAFCQPSQCSEFIKSMPDGHNEEGIWAEWGPSTSREAMHLNKPDDNVENADTFLGSGDDPLENAEPRKWLKTFLTKVKIVKSAGKLYSRFPDKSQFPSCSKVVSFNVFENDSTLLRFILNKNTGLDTEGDEMNISYTCCGVFVNNSHDLIGFVLKWVSVNTNDESERKQIKNVVVGKIVSWGIQWVCSVKLDEDVYRVPVDHWTDFKFFDKYLICLTSAGQIHFFGDITGDYMGRVDLLDIHGLDKLSDQTNDFVGKRVFRTLLVASRTSLLAAVDDYGIVYVTHSTDLLSDINYTVEKSLPQFQQLKYRALVGWEVGGADISHQRLYDNLSPNITFVRERTVSKDKMESNESVVTGFSDASQIVRQKTHNALRSIFLPTDKYSKDDLICLSQFGITRIHRNNNATTKTISRVIHCSFDLYSAMDDDKGSNGGQEVTVADAVGCMCYGCFYLVTSDSLSVVLPSISVASGCIPVEAIGFRQINCSLTDQSVNLIEIKGLKQPWPTWKMEVLDRVLLYEGHEEADHLCLENGNFFIFISLLMEISMYFLPIYL